MSSTNIQYNTTILVLRNLMCKRRIVFYARMFWFSWVIITPDLTVEECCRRLAEHTIIIVIICL